ncbi:Telomerase activating protein Est1 [Nesidiocoris tenuis]|uniref:Telomerase activating protein Est1 n=1 Tax=Nesidiocoris tenuis TaxID=355587 RepID=A0ABN7BCL4_9HEMI|nr:Telomerase activating protein Est1 [Nesidiocoris tenuis]
MKLEWNDQPPGEWWPQSNSCGGQFGMWAVKNLDVPPISNQEGTYSLFSGTDHQQPVSSNTVHSNGTTMNHQSLWSGPGPSPLERLLEQQKQLRNTMQYDT